MKYKKFALFSFILFVLLFSITAISAVDLNDTDDRGEDVLKDGDMDYGSISTLYLDVKGAGSSLDVVYDYK